MWLIEREESMENINKIKEVEPKPEVNIFMRKPFVAGERKQQEDMTDRGFQSMLDEDIEKLRNEGKSFDETVEEVLENEDMARDERLDQLRRAREHYDLAQQYRRDFENKGPRVK